MTKPLGDSHAIGKGWNVIPGEETFTPFRLEDYLKTDEDWDRYAEALSEELNRNTPPHKIGET